MSDRSDRTRIIVPQGFRELLGALCREILRHQPKNIVEFSAQYFEQKLKERDGGEQRLLLVGVGSRILIHRALETGDITDEVRQAAAVKIQAVFRGYLARGPVRHRDRETDGGEMDASQVSRSTVEAKNKRRFSVLLSSERVKLEFLYKHVEPMVLVTFVVAPVVLKPQRSAADDPSDESIDTRTSQIHRLRMFLNAFLGGGHPLPSPNALAHYMALRIQQRSDDTLFPATSRSFPAPSPPNNTPEGSEHEWVGIGERVPASSSSSSYAFFPRAPPNTPRPSFSDYRPWMKVPSASERSLRPTAVVQSLLAASAPPPPPNTPVPSKSLSVIVSIHRSNPASNLMVDSDLAGGSFSTSSLPWRGRVLSRQASAPAVGLEDLRSSIRDFISPSRHLSLKTISTSATSTEST